jgi:hypothetical protein
MKDLSRLASESKEFGKFRKREEMEDKNKKKNRPSF